MELVKENIYEIGIYSEMDLKYALLEFKKEYQEIPAKNTCLDFLMITNIYKGTVGIL